MPGHVDADPGAELERIQAGAVHCGRTAEAPVEPRGAAGAGRGLGRVGPVYTPPASIAARATQPP